MLKWRERVIQAETHGFTREDIEDSQCSLRCVVGEAAAILGVGYCEATRHFKILNWTKTGLTEVGGHFPTAISFGDVAQASKCVDVVEDKLLDLKRQQGGD